MDCIKCKIRNQTAFDRRCQVRTLNAGAEREETVRESGVHDEVAKPATEHLPLIRTIAEYGSPKGKNGCT